MNVENNTKIVKKEIIKLSLVEPERITVLIKLTDLTYKVLLKLALIIDFGRMKKAVGFSDKDTFQYSFQELADLSVAGLQKFDVDMVRNALSELLSKGFLFRDTDGCLAFTPTGSMQ